MLYINLFLKITAIQLFLYKVKFIGLQYSESDHDWLVFSMIPKTTKL
jgi:hypothetical protein